MNGLLICPWSRPEVPALGNGAASLACVPLLGQGIIEYWLSHLACAGAKELLILPDDRPDEIRALVGQGERWGLQIEIGDEQRELTPAQALLKYEKRLDPAAAQNGIALLDHFPGLPEWPLFNSYKDWFIGLQKWMPRAKTPDRVGIRQLSPGVYAGLNCHISDEADLRGPCWIGTNAIIRAKTVIGPYAIIEDGAFVDASATVTGSVVGKNTFVGKLTEIRDSFAAGNTLVNLESGSTIQVPDRFVLCALRQSRAAQKAGVLAKLAELCGKSEGSLLWKHLLMNKES